MTTTQTTTATETTKTSEVKPSMFSGVGKFLKSTAMFAAGAATGAGAYYLFEKFATKAVEVAVETVAS